MIFPGACLSVVSTMTEPSIQKVKAMWGRKRKEREAEEQRQRDEEWSREFRRKNPPPDISRGEIPAQVRLDSGGFLGF